MPRYSDKKGQLFHVEIVAFFISRFISPLAKPCLSRGDIKRKRVSLSEVVIKRIGMQDYR